MARQEIDWNEVYPWDFWLYEELEELDAELDASGVEDATEWERFGEMEIILGIIAEHKLLYEAYPYEQYEQDRAKLIAEGEDPRCIMSYEACIAYERFEREQEREREIWEAYDEAMRELEITREVAERDELTEYAEWAWECSMDELAAFGFIAIMDDFEELQDFALVDGYINALEEELAANRWGGAEIHEYNELMGEFCEMMGREYRV